MRRDAKCRNRAFQNRPLKWGLEVSFWKKQKCVLNCVARDLADCGYFEIQGAHIFAS